MLQELESSSGNMNLDDLKEWAANHQAELEKIISYLESIGKVRRESDGSITIL